MIEAKDLKIGNIITYKTPTNTGGDYLGVCIVKEVSENGFKAVDEWDVYQTNADVEYLGMPLTEEWLIKFGAYTLDDRLYFIEYGDEGRELKLYLDDGVIKMMFNEFWIIEIKYVHKWQNLHHELTGEELTIKE